MSTVRAATIADVAGTGTPDVPRGEFCRLRYGLNGTGTIALFDSFNVASVADNGTGDYTATLSVAFPNALWTAIASANVGQTRIDAFSTSTLKTMGYSTGSASQADCFVYAAGFGDKP